jgi:hypothetical protein
LNDYPKDAIFDDGTPMNTTDAAKYRKLEDPDPRDFDEEEALRQWKSEEDAVWAEENDPVAKMAKGTKGKTSLWGDLWKKAANGLAKISGAEGPMFPSAREQSIASEESLEEDNNKTQKKYKNVFEQAKRSTKKGE